MGIIEAIIFVAKYISRLFSIINLKSKGFVLDSTTDNSDKLIDLLNQIGDERTDIFVPKGVCKIGANITIPKNITLHFANGGMLSPTNGVTININCSINSLKQQIFTGEGDIKGNLNNGKIYPEWFGAKGDDSIDDTSSIQKACDFFPDGGIIEFSNKIYKFTEVSVTVPKINIKGCKTTIFRGKLKVGKNPMLSFFTISELTFKPYSLVNGSCGIEFSYIEKPLIENVRFENLDKAIMCLSIATFQHVKLANINKCTFYNVNYCLYGVKPSGFDNYMLGDIQFSNNQYCHANITHIYLDGIDGLIASSNTMFFPGVPVGSVIKTNNIYLNYANWISISGNNLFEAGTDSIVASRFQNLSINGNNIAWCGQVAPSNGIKLINGDQAGDYYSNATLCGNNINKPTGSGIYIDSHCGYIACTGNTVIAAGNSDYYYGATDINSVNHYGLVNESGSKKIVFSGNVTPFNSNLFNGEEIFYDGNYSATVRNKRKYYTLTQTTTVASLDMANYDIAVLAMGSTSTITNITGGYEGKEVSLYGYNNRATLQNNANIALKSGVDVNVPTDGVIVLKFVYTKWREVSRTF